MAPPTHTWPSSRSRWARPTRPSRVPWAAVYLADPSLTFHTGDTLVVDGGYTIF